MKFLRIFFYWMLVSPQFLLIPIFYVLILIVKAILFLLSVSISEIDARWINPYDESGLIYRWCDWADRATGLDEEE